MNARRDTLIEHPKFSGIGHHVIINIGRGLNLPSPSEGLIVRTTRSSDYGVVSRLLPGLKAAGVRKPRYLNLIGDLIPLGPLAFPDRIDGMVVVAGRWVAPSVRTMVAALVVVTPFSPATTATATTTTRRTRLLRNAAERWTPAGARRWRLAVAPAALARRTGLPRNALRRNAVGGTTSGPKLCPSTPVLGYRVAPISGRVATGE